MLLPFLFMLLHFFIKKFFLQLSCFSLLRFIVIEIVIGDEFNQYIYSAEIIFRFGERNWEKWKEDGRAGASCVLDN